MPFQVRATHVPELEEGDPAQAALENALRKARAAAGQGDAEGEREGQGEHERAADELVLGCDTVVALDGRIYGKPADAAAARATLQALSGRTHEVLSGLALLAPDGRERTALARTAVSFRTLDERLLQWYVAREEWRGRAGGYAIQGAGAALVREVRGDYENVVGLPLASLLDLCPELLAE